MSSLESLPSFLRPISIQQWNGSTHADIPYIPGLDIDHAHYRYVNQGFEREVHADEAVNSLGSDGFTRCSGLVLMDTRAKTFTLAHLEPYSDSIINHLDQKSKERVRKVALFYGSLSLRHLELENLISSNYFGPVQFKVTHFESGETSWGMVFNRANNQVKIFTRQPSQAITTFEL